MPSHFRTSHLAYVSIERSKILFKKKITFSCDTLGQFHFIFYNYFLVYTR